MPMSWTHMHASTVRQNKGATTPTTLCRRLCILLRLSDRLQSTELELESAGLGDLRDEVILDLDGAATSQIGVQFTPTLLQLDEEGRLSDEPVFGTEGVISQLEADKRVD